MSAAGFADSNKFPATIRVFSRPPKNNSAHMFGKREEAAKSFDFLLVFGLLLATLQTVCFGIISTRFNAIKIAEFMKLNSI